MPGRHNSSDSYRYGYQGSEKDDEVKGEGNSYTTQFRQLDPRIGRWLAKDPAQDPSHSAYCSMDNNPIFYNDRSGLYTERRANRVRKRLNNKGHNVGQVGKHGSGNRDYGFGIQQEGSGGIYLGIQTKGAGFASFTQDDWQPYDGWDDIPSPDRYIDPDGVASADAGGNNTYGASDGPYIGFMKDSDKYGTLIFDSYLHRGTGRFNMAGHVPLTASGNIAMMENYAWYGGTGNTAPGTLPMFINAGIRSYGVRLDGQYTLGDLSKNGTGIGGEFHGALGHGDISVQTGFMNNEGGRTGLQAKASAFGGLAEGEVKAKIAIFGYTIHATIGGSLGSVGAAGEIGIYKDAADGKTHMSGFGKAAWLFGGKLGIDIAW